MNTISQTGNREIQAIAIKCDNHKRKCKWTGTVGTIQEHLTVCKFALVPCPRDCKDATNKPRYIIRKDMDEHMKECPNRLYICEFCGEEVPYVNMMEHLDSKCMGKMLECPNEGCGAIIERRDYESHVITECEYTVIDCKYSSIGCDVELKRRDMPAHEEEDTLHVHLAVVMTVNLQERVIQLEQVVDEMEEEHSRSFVKKADKLEKELKALREERIKKLDMKTTNFEKALKAVKESLDSVYKLENRVMRLEKELTDCKAKRIKAVEDRILKLNDEIKERCFKFKLVDYQRRKESSERVESASYYSSPSGYNMTFRVDSNGYGSGKGTHVSVSAYIIKGKYDAELKWPFVGKIHFILMNQLEDNNHHQMTTELSMANNAHVGGPAWGKTQFILHSELEYNRESNTQYLKDDTLYFRVFVEVAERRPWLE